jgi:hypothetical protein
MSRWRSTWSDSAPEATPVRREAATVRTADPYTMNQEHPQPSPVEYESGDPDSWAETPANSDPHVKKEYEGDHVKRDDVGFGEFRDDTWKHKDSDVWGGKGKYDNASSARAAAERKASAAERVARVLLRSDNEKLIEAQAIDLMALPGPALASTLQRLEQASPDALPKEVKFRRALACCKLAARLLPNNTEEKYIEHVATMFMRVDDPTLKEILKTVKVAIEEVKEPGSPKEDEPKKPEKASAEMKEEKEPPKAEAEEEKEGEEAEEAAEGEGEGEGEGEEETAAEQCGCMDPEARAMLQQLLQEEAGESEHQGALPTPPPGAGPAPELTDLFEQPGAAPIAGPAAMMASANTPDITFDEEGDERTASDADANQLNSLFDDDPEVQANREIKAAEQEQVMRETGFARMASTGAKKLGQVKASKGQEASLDDLWERPGR